MRIVERPERVPHVCALTGRSEDRRGFVDTGVDLPSMDPRIYASYEGVKMAAALFGFGDPDELALLREENAELQRRVLWLEEELREADRFQESARYTLRKFGEEIKNKPGRPRKVEREAA